MNAVSEILSVKQPLGVTAYEQIYRRIMTLEYIPGQPLDEKNLMAELGIGRTPIREALLRLASDFMVESQPKRGCIVRPLTIQNTRAAFSALRIMEQGAAELALKQDNTSILPLMRQANDEVAAAITLAICPDFDAMECLVDFRESIALRAHQVDTELPAEVIGVIR